MNTVNVKNSLTPEQRKELADKLEKLMQKYAVMQYSSEKRGGPSSSYFAGVVDGMNNAWKLINQVDDDYNQE